MIQDFIHFRCNGIYIWNFNLNNCSCPSGWLAGPSKQCYYKSNATVTWDQAESDCISKNSHLISINSQAEADYLYSIRLFGVPFWVSKYIIETKFFFFISI